MSASLVGSEMCIRDRDHASQAGRAPRMEDRNLLVDLFPQLHAPEILRPCLLYTSDAADDM
eukprot:12795523-Alexandrium_andersonii.AAC.1